MHKEAMQPPGEQRIIYWDARKPGGPYEMRTHTRKPGKARRPPKILGRHVTHKILRTFVRGRQPGCRTETKTTIIGMPENREAQRT